MDEAFLRGFLYGTFEELGIDGRKELKKSIKGMENTEVGTVFLQELRKFD